MFLLRLSVIVSSLLFLLACETAAPILSSRYTDSTNSIEGSVYSLPRASVVVSIDTSKEANPISVKPLSYWPDPTARYVANFKFSATNDDDLKISPNDRGLLTSVTANTSDQTAKIVSDTLDGLNALIISDFSSITQFNAKTSQTFKGEIVVDPFRIREPKGVTITAEFIDPELASLMRDRKGQIRRDPCPADASICVPVQTPVILHYKLGDQFAFSHQTVVPDPKKVIGIRFGRNSCVESRNAITMKDGLVTNVSMTKPSEMAGCLGIPLDILSAIISAPIDAITGRTQKIEARTKLIDKQILLQERKEALAKSEAKATN